VRAATALAPTPLRAFDLQVASVTDLSPHFRRVTLAAPDLAALDHGGVLGPRDLRVKLVLPLSGRRVTRLEDLSHGWYQRWLALDPAQRGILRTYTVRKARVSGGDPRSTSTSWSIRTRGRLVPPPAGSPPPEPGRELTVIGPNAGAPPGVEWQPTTNLSRGRVLLIGDETAVPAIGSILESLPTGCTGHALLEVPVAEDFLHLPTRADLQVVWCVRWRRPRGFALTRAVRDVLHAAPVAARSDSQPRIADVDADAELLWDVPTPPGAAGGEGRPAVTAWLAGEAGVVRGLRRLLHAHGLGRGSLSAMGYWREGRPERT
jgi:iron complex transport system ATP-binding protein